MSVVTASSNVLDAGSSPAISTKMLSNSIPKSPKTLEKSRVFVFLRFRDFRRHFAESAHSGYNYGYIIRSPLIHSRVKSRGESLRTL